jgi:hypothetical protein
MPAPNNPERRTVRTFGLLRAAQEVFMLEGASCSRRRAASLAALFAALLAAPAPAGAAPPVLAASRVDRVVVYSDRARVFRSASLVLGSGEEQEAALADLPASALADTVRVESKTARITRVEVVRSRDRLPLQLKADALVKKIEALVDQMLDLADEQRVLSDELELLGSLAPRAAEPAQTARQAAAQPEGIFADAWERVLSWAEARSQKVRSSRRLLSSRATLLRERLHPLIVEASSLVPPALDEPVSRVVATLRGTPGRHAVVVSYIVPDAGWVPSYDLGYDHASRAVEVTAYAVVSQKTGEEWEGSRLEFSTGQPLGLVAVPEIPTILLGRKRDFTPVPRPRLEPAPRFWSAPSKAPEPEAAVVRLRELISEAESTLEAGRAGGSKQGEVKDKLSGTIRNPMPVAGEAAAAPPAKPEPEMKREAGPVAVEKTVELDRRTRSLSEEPVQAKVPPMAPGGSAAPPREELPWADGVYRPPSYDPDSPIAGAKGYLFTLSAPGRHTVRSSGASRRIPILRRRHPIDPVHRIVPGLSLSAYVEAELVNRIGLPILRGNAYVFADSMFTGRSWLNTALPGQKLRLPLGVDDSVKAARRVLKKTETRGILSREDATSFTIEIEVANNRASPIRVEIEDQVPVKLEGSDSKVEIRGFSSSSFSPPDKRGRVLFRGRIPASSVMKVSFGFQVVRPKDWEVLQHDD